MEAEYDGEEEDNDRSDFGECSDDRDDVVRVDDMRAAGACEGTNDLVNGADEKEPEPGKVCLEEEPHEVVGLLLVVDNVLDSEIHDELADDEVYGDSVYGEGVYGDGVEIDYMETASTELECMERAYMERAYTATECMEIVYREIDYMETASTELECMVMECMVWACMVMDRKIRASRLESLEVRLVLMQGGRTPKHDHTLTLLTKY
ncbi:MAG: hypothetical protein M1830_010208 [Pleopsidium flavum]|nr:MAG: hypothetical protein M1830_010208 [Pleopsidium flavum]